MNIIKNYHINKVIQLRIAHFELRKQRGELEYAIDPKLIDAISHSISYHAKKGGLK